MWNTVSQNFWKTKEKTNKQKALDFENANGINISSWKWNQDFLTVKQVDADMAFCVKVIDGVYMMYLHFTLRMEQSQCKWYSV